MRRDSNLFRRRLAVLIVLAMGAIVFLASPSAAQTELETTAQADADVSVLLRGPLHEAFAQPADLGAEDGVVVPEAPPEPIEELPPDVKPDEGALWIGGYWAWDVEQDQFIWVSGVWRVPPEERRWVPGYWTEGDRGYRWISGFWAPTDTRSIDYLPTPPESIDRGPTSAAPSDDHTWVNGSWVYQDDDYVWRPGYWARTYQGWVWVPSRYVWTPRGSIYVNGYWDFPLHDRGMCFAPVYFRSPIYRRTNYYYTPTTVVDLSRMLLHLFVRPNYGHYYYGDWYGNQYDRYGIYSPFAYLNRRGYDPIFSHLQWSHRRRGIDYLGRVQNWHRYLQRHEERRPPRTWDGRQDFVQRNREFEHLQNLVFAERLEDVVSEQPGRVRRIDDAERRRMKEGATAMRQVVQARVQSERDVAGDRSARTESNRRVETLKPALELPETVDLDQLRELSRQRGDRARARDRDVPRADARDRDLPRSDVRDRNVPRSDARDRDQPRSDVRDRNVPRSDARDRDQPRSDVRDRNVPRSDARDRDQPRSDVRDRNVPRARQGEQPRARDIQPPQRRSTRDRLPNEIERQQIPRQSREGIERQRDPRQIDRGSRDFQQRIERSRDDRQPPPPRFREPSRRGRDLPDVFRAPQNTEPKQRAGRSPGAASARDLQTPRPQARDVPRGGPDRNIRGGPDRNIRGGPDRNVRRGPDREARRGPDRQRGRRDGS